MIPFPSIKPVYSEEYLDTLSLAERQAAFFGVPKYRLHYASESFAKDPTENYNIHNFSTLYVNQLCISYDKQFNDALEILNNGCLWCFPPSLIIINAPTYFFEDSIDAGAGAFIDHILCSLAVRISQRRVPKTSDFSVNFLETMVLDYNKNFQMKPRHLLFWGPLTEYTTAYEYQRTIQFLFTQRNHTRVILTVTPNLGDLLKRLSIGTKHVNYFFNFSDIQQEPVQKEAVIKRARKKKVVQSKVSEAI